MHVGNEAKIYQQHKLQDLFSNLAKDTSQVRLDHPNHFAIGNYCDYSFKVRIYRAYLNADK